MSIATITNGMSRIRSAPPHSPIGVFKRPVGYREDDRKSPLVDPALDFVFGATVPVSAALRRGDPDLVGVFDGSQGLVWVEQQLRAVAKELHSKKK